MQRRFRQVCSALKEHTYMSYAKIASANGFSNINLIIIKATTCDDFPLQEKYIQQLMKHLSTSPSLCHSFAISFTRRFGTTRNWRVALKCLILLHRLLCSAPRNNTLWTELLWARSNALISLHPCHFKDYSSFNSVSYTNFIICYAHLLDEALNCVVLGSTKLESQQQEAEEKAIAMPKTFQEKMKEMGEMLEMLPQLQSLIDRVIDCYPVGVVAPSFIVQSALKLIVRDSFICYTKFRREMIAVLDNLLQMPYTSCIAAFNIYKKALVQTNQLSEFYERCKTKGLCGLYEYPLVEPILYIQIKDLENVLSGMWQLTESSMSPTCSSSSSLESPIDGGERHVLIEEQEFEDEEERPLIEAEVEDNEDVSWETVLESSISFSHAYQSDLNNFFYNREWDGGLDEKGHEDSTWKIASYKSPATAYNPFSEPN